MSYKFNDIVSFKLTDEDAQTLNMGLNVIFAPSEIVAHTPGEEIPQPGQCYIYKDADGNTENVYYVYTNAAGHLCYSMKDYALPQAIITGQPLVRNPDFDIKVQK